MQPLVIVAGGKNVNIRKQDGRSIRATMSRFVDRVIVGGNKGGAFGKQKIGNIHVGTFVCISSLMLLTGDYYAQKTASRRRI